VKRSDLVLFSESASRFIAEIDEGGMEEFEKAFSGLPCTIIGEVAGTKDSGLNLTDLNGKKFFVGAPELRERWRGY
jgi:phosphoribosylformylglycinamidine synthase